MPNILVTGASKGLGLEICRNLLQRGYVVIALARNMNSNLQQLLESYSGLFRFISFDLEKTDQIKDVIFKPFLQNKTIIHGFVSNAAIAYEDLITNINENELERMIKINQISPMILTKYVVRNMILHQTKGSIVHISSVSAHTGYKGLSMYASSKGAIEAFSKNTAREWGENEIRSNCIAAGFMETEMTSRLSEDQKQKIFNRTSLKSATEIESVAATAAFLLSSESASITGQVLHVDAGTI
jgi:3-oxoacyl-[acyl-carrier protein] reductase